MMPLFPAAAHSPITKVSAATRPKLVWVVFAGLLLGYLTLVAFNSSYHATGSDSSGYFNIVRQFRSGQLVERIPAIAGLAAPAWDADYQEPLGYRTSNATWTRVPTYPVGYPLHLLAFVSFIGGDGAGRVVALLLVIAAAFLTYGVGREFGLAPAWAAAGAALLLGCPLFLMFAIQPMSDVPATVWVLATVWAALRAVRRSGWAWAAGMAFAIAVLVRPSNALLIIPVAVLWGWRPKTWLWFGLAGLPGAVFLAWYNRTLYGTALTTGYGDVSSLFHARYVPHNALFFAEWLALLLTPLVTIPAVIMPFLVRTKPRLTLALVAWVAVFVGFYVFYFHSGEYWWYLRFILPMFPALIVAALMVMHGMLAQWPARASRVAALLLLVVALGWQATFVRQRHVLWTKSDYVPYLQCVDWMHRHAPANAIVLQMQLSGCFTYYTDLTVVRWDLIKPAGWVALRRAAADSGRPIYATLFDFEEPRAMQREVPGDWERVAELGRVTVWRLRSSSPTPTAG